MSTTTLESLSALYLEDETAWLDQMARLIAERRLSELDYSNLQEFLTDMARRDRREVLSRLTVLIAHRLKWEHQPEKRSTSWQATIAEQRRELEELLESGTLRKFAQKILEKAYRNAVEQATIETTLPDSTFPVNSYRSLDDWLARPE
ncbi:MAG TPA: DUF29 domain-containing protein [Isosphaeraceae bacterium]|nr:DUF29 domain-containing protein [Isosphaeraceae bacterium]